MLRPETFRRSNPQLRGYQIHLRGLAATIMDSPLILTPSTTAVPGPRALFSTLFCMRRRAFLPLFSLSRKTNDTRGASPLLDPGFQRKVNPHKPPKSLNTRPYDPTIDTDIP